MALEGEIANIYITSADYEWIRNNYLFKESPTNWEYYAYRINNDGTNSEKRYMMKYLNPLPGDNQNRVRFQTFSHPKHYRLFSNISKHGGDTNFFINNPNSASNRLREAENQPGPIDKFVRWISTQENYRNGI